MLPTCLAKIRDPQKALPLSWLAWFSRLFYIYRVLYFLCFFPLYRVVLTVYVREELGCRFYWLFALLSATVCGSLGLCFFFLFILCLMPLICCAFSFCHWAFLLWVPSDYFLLQYFDLYFFCCVHCGLTFFFLFAWGPTHRSHGFQTFLPVLLFLILCNKAPLSTLLPCLSCTSP